MDSDEEVLHVVKKRRAARRHALDSDSSEDSDIEMRSRTRGAAQRIHASSSSSDDEQSSNTNRVSQLTENRSNCGNSETTHPVTNNDSSDGEQADKCAICLSKFQDQDIATPESCDHTFCSKCLMKWAKKINTCPIDRQRFELILVRNSSGEVLKAITVADKGSQGEDSDSSEIANCIVCGDSNDNREILVCDQCSLVYHRDCINSPRLSVPLANPWWCPICAPYVRIRDRMVRNFQQLVRRRYRPAPFRAVPAGETGPLSEEETDLGSSSSESSNETPESNYESGRRLGRWVLSRLPNLQIQEVTDPSDSSSSESSDENSRINYNLGRRLMAREVRLRRQIRNNPARVGNRTVLLSQSILERADGLTTDGEEDRFDYGYANTNVFSRVRRQTFQRVKSSLLVQQTPAPVSRPRPATFASTSPTDLVCGNLQLQNLLHSPGSTRQSDSSITQGSSPVALQCPLNPSQNSPSKCGNNNTSQQNSTFAGSSSSSGSGSSQCRDLYSVASCSMMPSNSNAEGYDTDSCSMVTHRSYGSSSVPEELKHEDRESTHVKDNSKSHSDEDVDIYSDIESTNEDEVSLDSEMQVLNVGYKSDESRPPVTENTANAVDGSDSSDNDLVIDEDLPVEDEAHKLKFSPHRTMNSSINNDTKVESNDNSNNSNLEEECSSENSKAPKCIQSPDELGEGSQNSNSNYQAYNDSCDSFKKTVQHTQSEETKQGFYADSDADSEDVNSTGNEADEENSLHSNKASISEDHSRDFNLTNFTTRGGGLKLHFNLKALTSEVSRDDLYKSSKVSGKIPVVLDSSNSGGDLDNTENVSENEQPSNADQSDDFRSEEGHINESQMDSQEADSNYSNAKEESVEIEKNYSGSPQYEHSDASQLDDDEKSSDMKEDSTPYCEDAHADEDPNSPEKVDMVDCTDENPDDKFLCDQENDKLLCDQENSLSLDENVNETDECINDDNGNNFNDTAGENCTNDNEFKDVEKETDSNEKDDLGIEDISDASDELNQADSSMDCDQFDAERSVAEEVEKNVAQLFEEDSSPERQQKSRSVVVACNVEESKRPSSSSRHSIQDDQEEGEIIDEMPCRKKGSSRDYFDEDFMDSTPRVNISDLPRIPKIKRDNVKPNEVEEVPLEAKRTSVLGRVDLGSADISWKRLSQHTRERSYRDGRPKDESVLFRDREPRQKERKGKSNFNGRKNEEKYRDNDRNKKEDSKKQESSKSREKSSRDRKFEINKNDYEKTRRAEKSHSSSEKRDKDKHGKSHDRSNKDKYDRDSKKEKRDKHKDKSGRDHDKYERDKNRSEDKYKREVEQYISDDEYERPYEKSREKEYKHKHKDRRESRDRKAESNNKKNKDEKRKRSHSRDHYSDKLKEREVRKIDDKLKIVVEHKEAKKDKGEKHSEKKHSKKHRESSHHHHERKKKDVVTSPYSDNTPTPIESKEIFAKGDSIIINVNFNRASPREVLPASTDDVFSREKKSLLSDISKIDNAIYTDENSKSKHSAHDKDNFFHEALTVKGPSTPDRKSDKSANLSVGETYWHETDDVDACSPSSEKLSIDKNSSEKDDATPNENFGADDNVTDSDDNNDIADSQSKNDEFRDSKISDKQSSESSYNGNKESDSFNNSRCRSPQPRSPPSPADNDSYDPCEPTRSPSPPCSPVMPVPPPLPTKSNSDHPKPPPSPELPPLPPGPEPTDTIPHDDHRSSKSTMSVQACEIPSIPSSMMSQHPTTYTQTMPTETGAPTPNVLMPPPSFPPRNSPSIHSQQMLPPRTVSWQVTNPPPAPIMFQPNHVQPIIRGNFLPSHIPTMNMPPQNVSATLLPPTNSVPLMSQVRHLQMTPHGVMPNNTLMANVPINISQMQLQHLPHQVANAIAPQHTMTSLANHPSNLSAHGSAVVRLLSVQNQLPNLAVTIQNQHLANVLQNQTLNQFLTAQNQMQVPVSGGIFKPERQQKSSPAKEKSEVVDMDVDSPYSPGDSPSMDSNIDYSPATSPVQKSPVASQSKDPFDNLLGSDRTKTNQENNKSQNKASGKHRQSSNCTDVPNKKAKTDSKSDSSKNKHSIRLHVSEKAKSKKEQKIDKKDIFSKLEDTQLRILDELPSSAVEMQVKEKFLIKLNRQERVVEEVKLVLKPYYKRREVNKDEYKDILRKSVPKICHNKSGDINPLKVKHLVESYVKKVKHSRKRAGKHKSAKFS